jgi:xanthine dehydrogenase accessory factor
VIGDLVRAGDAVAEVGSAPVASAIDGLLRGLLADGVHVETGMKVGDVDPRGVAVDPYRISEKGRAIAAGTLEAILLRLAMLKAP